MSRVLVVHWNAAEAAERAARLSRAGHKVETLAHGGIAALRAVRERPPDAIVIDLSRLPSQGGGVATWFRQQKATRAVPILFVGGAEEKVARVRRLLPDALYTDWTGIRGAVRKAVRASARPGSAIAGSAAPGTTGRTVVPGRTAVPVAPGRSAGPVVPGTMDAYAGKPLAKRLGIRAGSTILLLGAPSGLEAKLGELPEGARLSRRGTAPARLVLLFARSRADLDRRFPTAVQRLAADGGLWIAWPKKASGVVTNLTQNHVRSHGLDSGLVDYKICSIDETWSGLLFTRRKAKRA
jgi:CheY-like chemotaxis protein